MKQSTFEIYQSRNKEWRWRLRAGNNKIIADSGEGYSRKSAAQKAVHRYQDATWSAEIVLIEPKK